MARTAGLPVQAQRAQQSRREQRIAILAALALAHLETHAVGRALDVGHLQGAHFGDPQAGGVGDGEQGAPAQGARGTDQAR